MPEQTNATVVTGQVNFDPDDLGRYDGDGGDKDIFTDYRVLNRYEKDRHIYMTGITSPDGFQGASAAFFQLAAPTLIWICDWTCARWNTQPPIPDPESKDPNWVLLDDCYELMNVTVETDGSTPLYRISGVYVYGCRNPKVRTTDNVGYPCPPFLSDVGIDRTMPKTKLEQGINAKVNQGGNAQLQM